MYLHEVVPSLKVRLDTHTRSPADDGVRLAIDQPTLHLRIFHEGTTDTKIDIELKNILTGLAQLINRFLAESGSTLITLP